MRNFTIFGRKKLFSTVDSYAKIPEFWMTHWKDGGSKIVSGMYGLCIDLNGTNFDYYIADEYKPTKNASIPTWTDSLHVSGISDGNPRYKNFPEGYETRTLPKGTWAVFPCTLGTLQDTNTKMWRDWIPYCREYRLGGNYNIERYMPLCQENPSQSYCELWLPLEKV